MNTINPVKAYWQQRLLSPLPPESEIRARNGAINASYASWFSRHPDWFRWAGMASFASSRVGLLLAVYDYSYIRPEAYQLDAGTTHPDELRRAAARALQMIGTTDSAASRDLGGLADLFDDSRLIGSLEMLRRANNNAFANSGWAHLAYESPAGGIAAVEKGLGDDPTQHRLLRGFRLIEAARRFQAKYPARAKEADDMFWRGNLLLLQHEQWGVIQEHFAQLELELGLGLTIITSLDFDANHLVKDKKTYCGFYEHMWTRGLPVLVRTLSLPNITVLDHRWSWVRWLVFPTWRRVVAEDKALSKKIARIISNGRPFDPSVFAPESAAT